MLKAILGYIASLRPAWSTQNSSKTKTKQNNDNKTLSGFVSLLVPLERPPFLCDKGGRIALSFFSL